MAWVDDDNAALLTDLYEVTMAAAYLADDLDHEATFELWVRSVPAERRFLLVAGLDTALTYLERLRFTDDAIDYLATQRGLTDEFRARLAGLRFSGSVHAMPEGTIAFPAEPLLRVTAPLIEAQIVETFLLNAVGFQTMIATKAARMHLACGGRAFVDFGGRRAHGADAAVKAARASYIGGASATSLVLAGQAYGIPVTGTMAHSFILAHTDEGDAFRSFARTFAGDDIVLLIDTFDTLEGARIAATVIGELAADDIPVRAVRIDSGDLGDLAHQVRRILDDTGLHQVGIVASGSLDEHRMARLVADGAPIDSFGVGTTLVTSEDAPSIDVIYKLVADRGEPRMKTSTGKVTLPGVKQVFRSEAGDVIARADEDIPGAKPLLEAVMVDGTRTRPQSDLAAIRDRALQAVDGLPPHLKDLDPWESPAWPVTVSDGLQALADEMSGK